MPGIKRKSFTAKRNGRFKRSRGFRRHRKSFRKNTRQVYRGKRSASSRIIRPTVRSIFKSNNPIKFKDIGTLNWNWSAGVQGVQLLFGTPKIDQLQTLFAAAFPGLTYAGKGVPPTPGTSYGDQARMAYSVSRRNDFQNQTATPVYLTVYRLRARDDFNVDSGGVLGPVSSGTTDIQTWLFSLWDQANVSIGNTAPVSKHQTIGITPFDSPSLCRNFKIIAVKKRFLKPTAKWASTWKCRPRTVDAFTLNNSHAILKGEIFELYCSRGTQGIIHDSSHSAIDGKTTTSNGEISCITTWNYIFAAEPGTTAKYEKYLNNQMPNAYSAGVSASNIAAEDNSFAVMQNTLYGANYVNKA